MHELSGPKAENGLSAGLGVRVQKLRGSKRRREPQMPRRKGDKRCRWNVGIGEIARWIGTGSDEGRSHFQEA